MARMMQLQPVTFSTADVVTVSTNAGGPVACTLSSATNRQWLLAQAHWYVAAPTSQTLTVYRGTSSGTAIFVTGVNSTQGTVQWHNPLSGAVGGGMTVVLTSATGGGTVHLNVSAYPEA